MASAVVFTHEHHRNQHILSREDAMKKASKIPKLDVETSDDSRTRKRKSMSLNEEGVKEAQSGTGFSTDATTTVDLSALSKDDRKDLRKRLRLNLEQVKNIAVKIGARLEQLKLQPHLADRGVRPSNSDAHLSRTDNGGSAGKEVTSEPASTSGETPHALSLREARLARQPSVIVSEGLQGTPGFQGKEKRTPKANQLYLNSEFVSGKDKMPPPEKLKPKAASGVKRGAQGKADGKTAKRQKVEAARLKRMNDLLKQCGTVLKKLMAHKHAWVFNDPVDAEKLALHDYHKVIKRPMDLGTIKKNMESGMYASPKEFADDVYLTFSNAMTYNPHGHDVYVMAEALKTLFNGRWKDIERKYEEEKSHIVIEEAALATDGPSGQSEIQDLKQHLRRVEDQMKVLTTKSRPAPVGRSAAQAKPRPDDLEKRPMTFDEKRKLSVNLEGLPGDKLERIVQIIKKRNPDLSQHEDEIEVDIDSFDNDTLWELDRFVTNCMKSRGKNRKKASAKAQFAHSGAVQSPDAVVETPRKARTGGDAGEEDVDIDDDLAPAQFAPVVIDKDGGGEAGCASKTSNSSSDSSDSGSSSSDSDSGSSSGSESEADEAQSADAGSKASHDKEPVGSGAVRELKGSPAPETDIAKREDLISAEAPNLEREASPERQVSPERLAAPERQVSPEKQLRAALLRGRFADTILKAKEKTLPVNKNDKVDPEKLRKDREELERHQKEERARLQAEAKAAEVAKRKAEEQVALEVKLKREVERQAARQALQQMEKTVEIDENSEILKDLERLRSVSMDQIVGSSGEEASPGEGSPDGLPAFALQGGNPLEQLGLFMKDDEDEDEHHGGENDKIEQAKSEQNVDTNGDVDVEEGEID